MTTHQDVVVALGFTGPLTGNVTGNITGNLTGGEILPTASTYSGASAPTKAISPADFNVHLTKGTAGIDYTLAAPGSANVGHVMRITTDTAAAHVVTVTGLLGGTTLTFAAAIGNGVKLLAVSATIWRLEANVGITQS